MEIKHTWAIQDGKVKVTSVLHLEHSQVYDVNGWNEEAMHKAYVQNERVLLAKVGSGAPVSEVDSLEAEPRSLETFYTRRQP